MRVHLIGSHGHGADMQSWPIAQEPCGSSLGDVRRRVARTLSPRYMVGRDVSESILWASCSIRALSFCNPTTHEVDGESRTESESSREKIPRRGVAALVDCKLVAAMPIGQFLSTGSSPEKRPVQDTFSGRACERQRDASWESVLDKRPGTLPPIIVRPSRRGRPRRYL
jgi:hypothetical protein